MADTPSAAEQTAAGGIAQSATASQELVKQWGTYIGQHLAEQQRAREASARGPADVGTVRSGIAPVLTAPHVMPMTSNVQPVPYTTPGMDYGDRERQDTTDVVNMLRGAVHGVTAQKQARDYEIAKKDYELLTTLMAAKKADPTNQHNIELLNTLLDPESSDGKKRIARLKKVFDIDVMNQQQAAKHNADPEVRAHNDVTAKLKASGGVPTTGVISQSDADLPPGAAVPVQQPVVNTSGKLNSAAQAFENSFPQALYREVVPTNDEMLRTAGINNKTIADANTQVKADADNYKTTMSSVGDVFKGVNDLNIADINNKYKVWSTIVDKESAWNIAKLHAQTEEANREVERLKVKATNKNTDMQYQGQLLTAADNKVDIAYKNYTAVMTLHSNPEIYKKLDDKAKQTVADERRAALNNFQEAIKDRESVHDDLMNMAGTKNVGTTDRKQADAAKKVNAAIKSAAGSPSSTSPSPSSAGVNGSGSANVAGSTIVPTAGPSLLTRAKTAIVNAVPKVKPESEQVDFWGNPKYPKK